MNRVQRKLTEKEWEYDAIKRDFDSQKELIRRLREEKLSLEKENEDLKRELSSSQALVSSPGGGRDDNYELVAVCLLYTSPSPRDLSTSRMPSSA